MKARRGGRSRHFPLQSEWTIIHNPNGAGHVGEHFLNGQDKNQIWVSDPSATFSYGRKGGMDHSTLNYLVFFKEWVVFVLLPPVGIYRTYYPTHEIKTTSFCVILVIWG